MSVVIVNPYISFPESQPLVLVYNVASGGTAITVPFVGNHNIEISWGDGLSNSYSYTGTAQQDRTHTYASPGIYTVSVTGSAAHYGAVSATSRPQLIRCLSFGQLGITSLRGAFRNCLNLIEVPALLPSSVTDLSDLFLSSANFNSDIYTWDTSNVTSMSSMFSGASAFNRSIGGWNVANVTAMDGMFSSAVNFNQPISAWNTGKVQSMAGMFSGATNFDQYIESWQTSSVYNMTNMFGGATSFNQSLSGWNVSNTVSMSMMFSNASNFNQNLSAWCVGNILSEPSSFSVGSALSSSNKPVWGTCPNYSPDGSISFLGAVDGGTSATLPAHQEGDLIFAFAFRSGSTLAITQPSGWTSLVATSTSTNYVRLSAIVATSSSHVSGAWTGSTKVLFAVYRGAELTSIFNNSQLRTASSGSSVNVTYGTNTSWPNLAWTLNFMAHRSTDQPGSVAPTGITTRFSSGEGCRMFLGDSASTTAGFNSQVVNVGGTSSSWYSLTVRLRNKLVGP